MNLHIYSLDLFRFFSNSRHVLHFMFLSIGWLWWSVHFYLYGLILLLLLLVFLIWTCNSSQVRYFIIKTLFKFLPPSIRVLSPSINHYFLSYFHCIRTITWSYPVWVSPTQPALLFDKVKNPINAPLKFSTWRICCNANHIKKLYHNPLYVFSRVL